MRKSDLEKNYLDLEYQRSLQFLNAILIIGAGSLIAYLAALILNTDKWIQYSLIILVILLFTVPSYLKINNSLKEISIRIKSLKIE